MFLDRDGVLNERPREHDYVRDVSQLHLLPGIAQAGATLRAAGYALVVVSNQRGVARGMVCAQTLVDIEALVQRELATVGTQVDAFYYCPHDLDAGCECRKPRPGMLLTAMQDLDLDLAASALIGDSESDIWAGRAVGVFTVRIGGGATSADAVAIDLLEAAQIIAARSISSS